MLRSHDEESLDRVDTLLGVRQRNLLALVHDATNDVYLGYDDSYVRCLILSTPPLHDRVNGAHRDVRLHVRDVHVGDHDAALQRVPLSDGDRVNHGIDDDDAHHCVPLACGGYF